VAGQPRQSAQGQQQVAAVADAPERARAFAADPRIETSAIEQALHSVYSHDTVAKLRARYPRVRFVFLMGADNLAEFHRWKRWREVAHRVPFAVVDRAGISLRSLASPATQALARYRRRESAAPGIARARPPIWVFLHGMKSPLSSTAIRLRKKRKG
jgi:nicotinate-nucleotide adenylyltransferase